MASEWKAVSRILNAYVKTKDAHVILVPITVKGKTVDAFKYAPGRAAINRDPSRTDAVVQGDILEVVEANPAASGAAIREKMRALYGKLSHVTIDKNVDALVAAGKIVTKPGLRNTILHFWVEQP